VLAGFGRLGETLLRRQAAECGPQTVIRPVVRNVTHSSGHRAADAVRAFQVISGVGSPATALRAVTAELFYVKSDPGSY
jgi:hypothetical protein